MLCADLAVSYVVRCMCDYMYVCVCMYVCACLSVNDCDHALCGSCSQLCSVCVCVCLFECD